MKKPLMSLESITNFHHIGAKLKGSLKLKFSCKGHWQDAVNYTQRHTEREGLKFDCNKKKLTVTIKSK